MYTKLSKSRQDQAPMNAIKALTNIHNKAVQWLFCGGLFNEKRDMRHQNSRVNSPNTTANQWSSENEMPISRFAAYGSVPTCDRHEKEL